MIRRPPRSTRVRSSAASDVYKRQALVVQDEPMRHLSRILCATAVVVGATASCGGSATTPTRPATPTSQSQPAVFPLTVTRTGGIAGFRDVLVVAGDGLVSVTRKGQAPCLLY